MTEQANPLYKKILKWWLWSHRYNQLVVDNKSTASSNEGIVQHTWGSRSCSGEENIYYI